MRHAEDWVESKVMRSASGRYVPNPRYVALGSRIAVQAMIEPYRAMIGEHARGRMLDLGCGDVPYYPWYRERVSAITCVDWSASLHGRSHVDREVDLNGELPFAAESFDTVLLADVLEHIAAPGLLLREIARVLSPGGKLLITVPFLYQVHEAPHDYFRYTEFALTRLCSDAGFASTEVQAYGGYPDVLLDVLTKGLASVPPLCHALLFCTRWLLDTAPYKKLRKNTVHRFPLGYCAVAHKA